MTNSDNLRNIYLYKSTVFVSIVTFPRNFVSMAAQSPWEQNMKAIKDLYDSISTLKRHKDFLRCSKHVRAVAIFDER